MVKESFVGPAILFYLASDANKNKRQDHLNRYGLSWKTTFKLPYNPGHNDHRGITTTH